MLNCKDLVQQHASDHIDGHLHGQLKWNVRLHLVLCGPCRRFVNQLNKASVLIRENIGLGDDKNDEAFRQVSDSLWKTYRNQHPSDRRDP